MKVLALDPGRTTGVALLKETFFSYEQAELDHGGLYRFLQRIDPNIIVCEEFSFRKGVPQGVDLYPAELIGIVHFYAYNYGKPVTLQQPSIQSKKTAYFSDAELKRLELYQKGLEHGRSAAKHLLYWLQFGSGSSLGYDIEKLELVDFEWLVIETIPITSIPPPDPNLRSFV